MFHFIWQFFHVTIYEPLYNALVFLIAVIPGHSIGIAVVLLTIVVRLVLYPSSKKAIISQMKLLELQPQIEEIGRKHKDKAEERARLTMALYKEKGVNPFAPLTPLLLQLPIIFTLYAIFAQAGLPTIKPEFLYSFVQIPPVVNTHLFSIFDVTGKSIAIALLTGISQFFQAFVYQRLTKPLTSPVKDVGGVKKPSFQADFQKSMNIQMLYVFPFFIAFITYQLPAVAGIYWTTTNLFSIVQELITRRPPRLNGGVREGRAGH